MNRYLLLNISIIFIMMQISCCNTQTIQKHPNDISLHRKVALGNWMFDSIIKSTELMLYNNSISQGAGKLIGQIGPIYISDKSPISVNYQYQSNEMIISVTENDIIITNNNHITLKTLEIIREEWKDKHDKMNQDIMISDDEWNEIFVISDIIENYCNYLSDGYSEEGFLSNNQPLDICLNEMNNIWGFQIKAINLKKEIDIKYNYSQDRPREMIIDILYDNDNIINKTIYFPIPPPVSDGKQFFIIQQKI
jgi:hypothetical protein